MKANGLPTGDDDANSQRILAGKKWIGRCGKRDKSSPLKEIQNFK
jgi:hypothetical protein